MKYLSLVSMFIGCALVSAQENIVTSYTVLTQVEGHTKPVIIHGVQATATVTHTATTTHTATVTQLVARYNPDNIDELFKDIPQLKDFVSPTNENAIKEVVNENQSN